MSNDVLNVHPEIQPGTDVSLAGSATIGDLRSRMQHMQTMIELKREFLKNNLKEGIDRDYAKIPGTQKNSLLKPGAEKLLDWHGYYATFELRAHKEDWDIGLFAYTYRCVIMQRGSNVILCDCEGDCSNMESKYRFEWKKESDLPVGADIKTLIAKNFGSSERPFIKYQVVVANGADKRNTMRKMAQKRALIGATVLATATSDLFSADEPEDPEEKGPGTGSASSSTHNETGTAAAGADNKADYGNPISEPQGKRLYAIRKTHKIDDKEFKDWLKAKYGWTSDREIGYKAYEEICKACESGKLEMPAEATPTESAPKEPAAAPGAKVSVIQIKAINAAIRENEKDSKDFQTFLEIFDRAYVGKGVNDILASDFDQLMAAWDKAVKAMAV